MTWRTERPGSVYTSCRTASLSGAKAGSRRLSSVISALRPGAMYLLDLRRLQPYAMREREALIQQPDASQMADERAAVGAIVIARDRRVSFRLVDMAEHPQIGALRQPRQQVEIFLGADFR